jgi:hypothetical protein
MIALAALLLKLYGTAGLLVGLRDAWREVYALHRSLLHPYGHNRWHLTLSQLHWIVFPLYLLVYVVFWPVALFDKKRWY